MRFANIIQALYCDMWLISPNVHSVMCGILEKHLTGDAHKAGGIADTFEAADPPKAQLLPNGIAIIPISGVVGKRVGKLERSSGVMDIDDIGRMIDDAEQDEQVRGILLDVDSPGGTVTGVPEVAAMIRQCVKPVAAYTETLACSAAYWLASQADIVLSSASATVGSIGVYVAWMDRSREMEAAGIKQELVKAGKYKAMGIPGIPLTEEQRAQLQGNVDDLYGWFARDVTDMRNVGADAMQGQTFMGHAAAESGLVDMVVGGKREAIQELLDLIES